MTCILDLPQDLLFYLVSFLNLADIARCLQACSSLRQLSHSRALWIDALRRERLIKPIATTFHDDLSQHSVARLREIAFHTLRLEHNWSLPEPQVVSRIRVVKLSADSLDIIFQIPATDLYLLHSRRTGYVQVWDVEIGKPVSELLYVSKRIMDVSPGMEDVGVYAMAFLVSDVAMEDVTATNLYHTIKLIQVNYGPSGVQLSISFVGDTSPSLYLWAVFLTHDFVGVLQCHPLAILPPDQPSTMDIVAYNLKTRRKTTIHTDIERNEVTFDHQSGTSVQDGNINILIEYKLSSSVYCCPRAYLPTDDNPDCPKVSHIKLANTKYRLGFQWPRRKNRYTEPEGALSADPLYGVPAVSVHMHYMTRSPPHPSTYPSGVHIETTDVPYAMQVRFWTTGSELDTPPKWGISPGQGTQTATSSSSPPPNPVALGPSDPETRSSVRTQQTTTSLAVGRTSAGGELSRMATASNAAKSPTELDDDDDWSPKIIKPIYIAVVPGSLSDSSDSCWQLMLIPRSGRKALLVVQENEPDPERELGADGRPATRAVLKLKMASLDWEKKKTSVHTLSIPPFIDLKLIYGLSLDDHKGVVTLVDKRGYMYVLPYA